MSDATTNMTYAGTDDGAAIAAETDVSGKPWADIVLASLAINLVTLSGVFLTAATRCCARRRRALVETLLVPSFAAGALLATAVFLLIPESLELLIHAAEAEAATTEADHAAHARLLEESEEAHHEESASFAWKFGAAVLGGFLLPLVLHAVLPQAREIVEECEECQQQADDGEELELAAGLSAAAKELVEGGDDAVPDGKSTAAQKDDDDGDDNAADLRTMESGCDAHECGHANHRAPGDTAVDEPALEDMAVTESETPPQPHRRVNLPLTTSILLGDAIHNFTDGVFLSNAFLLCSRDIAWTMVATTIYHELAQELADYIVLTGHCGLPIWKALLLNFISGLSVLLGAITILAADLSPEATGVILAVSGGVYLYITAVECVPRVLEVTRGNRRRFGAFLGMFTVGAVPIGLVLLNHGHCGSE